MTRNDYALAYSRSFSQTVNFLISRGATRDCAEEAAQAAWTRGWERLHQLRNQSLLTTWINTIAFNCFRQTIRREKYQEVLTEVRGETSIDMSLDLARVLDRCREPYRALLLQQLAGKTVQEIASDLGSTATAVRLRLMRARRSARKAVGRAPVAILSATCG